MKKTALPSSIIALLSIFMLSGCAWLHLGETCLVEDGRPCADIVISGKPPRATKLAALELRTYIEKISGAKLPIVTMPGTNVGVHIYVGKSEYTDRLKITDEGLKGGAFRMVSGKDYLVLMGHDKDFVAPPWMPRSGGDIPRGLKEWDARTGEHWGNLAQQWWGASPVIGLWEYDERGNAECRVRVPARPGRALVHARRLG